MKPVRLSAQIFNKLQNENRLPKKPIQITDPENLHKAVARVSNCPRCGKVDCPSVKKDEKPQQVCPKCGRNNCPSVHTPAKPACPQCGKADCASVKKNTGNLQQQRMQTFKAAESQRPSVSFERKPRLKLAKKKTQQVTKSKKKTKSSKKHVVKVSRSHYNHLKKEGLHKNSHVAFVIKNKKKSGKAKSRKNKQTKKAFSKK